MAFRTFHHRLVGLMLGVGAVVSAWSTPTTSGIFADVRLGAVWHELKEFVRGKDQTAVEQVTLIHEGKTGAEVGLSAGAGLEIRGKVYLGVRGHGHFDLTNITETDAKKTFTGLQIALNGVDVIAYEGFYTLSARPRWAFGADLLIGAKLAPNILGYGFFGFENRKTFVSQQINAYTADGRVAFFIANGGFKPFKDVATSTQLNVASSTTNPCPEIQFSAKRFLFGVGARLYTSAHLYMLFEVSFSLGKATTLEPRFFNKTNDLTYGSTPLTTTSTNLHTEGAHLILQPGVGANVRCGLGFQF